MPSIIVAPGQEARRAQPGTRELPKAQLGKEIVLKVVNDIGVLADISKIVAEKGISIKAVSCWSEGGHGIVHLVTDDNLRASDALKKAHYEVREEKVILAELPHKPGMLKHMTEALKADGIDIHHLYVSADGAEKALIVLSSSDNDRAAVAINQR